MQITEVDAQINDLLDMSNMSNFLSGFNIYQCFASLISVSRKPAINLTLYPPHLRGDTVMVNPEAQPAGSDSFNLRHECSDFFFPC